jgi:hypothetical protein
MKSKKIHRKRSTSKSVFDLERLFELTKYALISDLNVNVTYSGSIKNREPEHPNIAGCSPYLFKRFTQVLNFDKRVIWTGDTSFADLSKDAFAAFADSQATFGLPEPLSRREDRVIQTARDLCSHILGPFSYDAWFDSCSFGKRAAVGLPRSKSYLDNRFERLSGTRLQWTAFNHCLSRDIHLLRAVRERLATRVVVNEIKATTVPKSFKAARIIAPDTVLGGFLSRGLGEYIRKRLEKETHIDLATQQGRHRRWAKSASKHGKLSTIDMSKASDSFTWRHIEKIVPEDWHHALDCVRTRRCNVDGSVIDTQSYMLMGSGHTFPLQTLLFFCLAEATRQLLRSTGKVSVYGDDIIIPTKMAKPLIVVLQELGFVINSEKSFYDDPDVLRPTHTFFRESCGGDYKGGVDVRPYMPECDLSVDNMVPRNEYIAWIHKFVNGLLDHWDACELPSTLGFLLHEVNRMKRAVCFVPAWEVDHAGIKHYLPPYLLIGLEVSFIKYEDSYPTYFRLTFSRPKRKQRVKERPYVWYSYFLHRETGVDAVHPNCIPWEILPMSFDIMKNLRNSERKEAQLPYSSTVSLDGEDRKDVKGVFRWKKREPKRH